MHSAENYSKSNLAEQFLDSIYSDSYGSRFLKFAYSYKVAPLVTPSDGDKLMSCAH